LGGALVFAVACAAIVVAVFKKPTESDYRLARGRSQLFTENYLAALQTLRDIPDAGKGRPEAHSYLGAAYLKLHLYKAAIKEFEEATKAQPRESDPWVGLASSYIELGDGQKAIERATRATDPNSPDFVKKYVNFGASVRAAQFLVLAAKARALMKRRYHVTYEDVSVLMKPILRHRILLNFQAESDHLTQDDILSKLLEAMPAPRE